ncbi:hypothetical protein H1P_2370015 [Hyella patelloides LEGE 07179]|uniref:Uncharacterized protein n=1 Tax=Hyella patelloides LEGE 07179 TaxID=945734 RepID=A0A563VRM9_9CYAN|nr:hypothetical protein H1P_2370015 [Hyella patelloides LEGE 07179]
MDIYCSLNQPANNNDLICALGFIKAIYERTSTYFLMYRFKRYYVLVK